MRKIAQWLSVISILIFIISWGLMGLKILDNDYLITTQAYVGLVCIVIYFVCVMYIKFTNRCPHCGKVRQTIGNFCPYCGKEIK